MGLESGLPNTHINMFNSLLGRSNGGGNGRYEDTLPNVGSGVMFNEADAAGDFKKSTHAATGSSNGQPIAGG